MSETVNDKYYRIIELRERILTLKDLEIYTLEQQNIAQKELNYLEGKI